MLIRRFEERAGEMYARARIGGFLHLSIGEEATIVGSARALRDSDYLISTYRSHGHALVRGTPPERVMAELFGRVDGCCRGRGGSMHMFDGARRFMGGYGIVGGNLPIAAGIALASDYAGTDEVTLCMFGDGASNQGTFGETLNLAALWRLPVLFMVTNNQFGMGTSLERHSAVTDLQRKGESLGVPGMRCDGMDVLDTYRVVSEALELVRERAPPAARRGDHLPLPRPLDGRPRAVPHAARRSASWRERDPIPAFAELLIGEGPSTRGSVERSTPRPRARSTRPSAFAEASPFPAAGVAVRRRLRARRRARAAGTRSRRPTERAAGRAEDGERRATDEIPQQLTSALAVARGRARGAARTDGRAALPRGARGRAASRRWGATSASS